MIRTFFHYIFTFIAYLTKKKLQ